MERSTLPPYLRYMPLAVVCGGSTPPPAFIYIFFRRISESILTQINSKSNLNYYALFNDLYRLAANPQMKSENLTRPKFKNFGNVGRGMKQRSSMIDRTKGIPKSATSTQNVRR